MIRRMSAAAAFAFHVSVAAAQAPSAQTASAQAPSLIGAWDIEFAAGQRIENGEATVIMAKGTLTVAQHGDSLVATLVRVPAAGATAPASPPMTMRGAMGGQGAVFVHTRSATIYMNGEESKRDITVTWTLTATGDALTGTMATVMQDNPMAMEPTKVTGTRART